MPDELLAVATPPQVLPGGHVGERGGLAGFQHLRRRSPKGNLPPFTAAGIQPSQLPHCAGLRRAPSKEGATDKEAGFGRFIFQSTIRCAGRTKTSDPCSASSRQLPCLAYWALAAGKQTMMTPRGRW